MEVVTKNAGHSDIDLKHLGREKPAEHDLVFLVVAVNGWSGHGIAQHWKGQGIELQAEPLVDIQKDNLASLAVEVNGSAGRCIVR